MFFLHIHNLHALPGAGDCVLLHRQGHLLAHVGPAGAGVSFPLWDESMASLAREFPEALQYLGTLGEAGCWLLSLPDEGVDYAPEGFLWISGRDLIGQLDPAQVQALCCALSLHWWRRRSRFCGVCGAHMEVMEEECAARCPECGELFYPTASAAVIVAVTRGETILLAHNSGFQGGLFSTLAGFVDPGESIEQAVAREIREEVGIEVEGLEYVASQHWPFPNSLMIGFRARHKSGEIHVDGREIETADWFTRYHLPQLPRHGSVARLLIEDWLKS